MRLLHTSDWHLGRSFHGHSLDAAQAAWVDHVVATVAAERVDIVLVSGDVFDRALPSLDAVALWDTAVARLADAGARLVVVPGNHDSAHRLGLHRGILGRHRVHLMTELASAASALVVRDEHGAVAFYGIPYLEPPAVAAHLGVPPRHDSVLGAVMGRVRHDLARRQAVSPGVRSVVLAHAFVTGADRSDSEREISVGGVGDVPATTFAGPDYVALGHLHGPQAVTGSVRYSGSPIAYSFSEARHRKSSWLVELGPDGVSAVERVDAPVLRRLAQPVGTLADLLAAPGFAAAEDCWVHATVTDAVRPDDLKARLAQRFPWTVRVSWEPADATGADGLTYADRVRDRDDVSLVCEFVRHVRGSEARVGERELVVLALEEGRRAGQEPVVPDVDQGRLAAVTTPTADAGPSGGGGPTQPPAEGTARRADTADTAESAGTGGRGGTGGTALEVEITADDGTTSIEGTAAPVSAARRGVA